MIMLTEFRAWDKHTQKMYQDFDQKITEIPLGQSIHIFVYRTGLIFNTLMQFTGGLKDKNGKVYCQDDIVKYKNKLYRLIKGNYQFQLAGFNESGQDDPCDFFSEDAFPKGEIVGNIYQNPELLDFKI